MNLLEIICSHDPHLTTAQHVASQLNLTVNTPVTAPHYRLEWSQEGAQLQVLNQGKQTPIRVDLHTGSANHRRKFGGGNGQMIAKAVGLSGPIKPRVLDATAGLGGDAFVLASLGCTVRLQERSPIAHALLADGIARASTFAEQSHDDALMAVMQRITLEQGNSIECPVNNVDVIYLDPMFPLRKKSAAVNKSMRAFHDLIGNDNDADALFEHAIAQDVCRVVVKRPRIAPHLANKTPSYTLEGKSSRFDIYAFKKITTTR